MRIRFSSMLLASALFAVAACGDNNDVDRPVDAAPSDTAIDGPDIDAPDIDAPDIDAPDIDAPDIDAPDIDAPDIDAPDIDAPDIDAPTDAPDVDAPTDAAIDAPAAVGDHLLITEVGTVGSGEFVEIYNPTDQVIDLRDYYVSDDQSYFTLPGVVAGNLTAPAVSSDFLARFPVGATIAPRQVVVVSTDAVGFETAYTQVPDYTVQELGNSTAMELLWQGATPNPGLTNSGEMVVLFYWDGASDLVQDVDIFIAGNAPSAANTLIAKTDIDGPDADTTASSYATDALTIQDMESDTANDAMDRTYKRIGFETGNEVSTGGNGITGHDETSEQSRATWDSQAAATDYTTGTPGTVPAALNP